MVYNLHFESSVLLSKDIKTNVKMAFGYHEMKIKLLT